MGNSGDLKNQIRVLGEGGYIVHQQVSYTVYANM
jgi:hypothetical protein